MKHLLSIFLALQSLLLVNTLARAQDLPDPATVGAALATLSPTNNTPRRAVEVLVARATRDPSIRLALEDALIGILKGDSTYEAKRFACYQLAVLGTDRALAALKPLLKDQPSAALACLALAAQPSPTAAALLRDTLPTLTGSSQIQVLITLGTVHDDATVDTLASYARGNDLQAAAAAIFALGKIADPAAAKIITNLRKNPKPELAAPLRDAALSCAEGLARSDKRSAARDIYNTLLASSQPAYIRRASFNGLLRLEPAAAEARILDALRGSDATLKPAAIAALRNLRSEDASARFARELPLLEPDEQAWLLESLAARADKAARAAIFAQIGATNLLVRNVALQAAGRLGDASTVPALLDALARATDPAERASVEQALIALRGAPATDQALVRALFDAPPATQARLMAVLALRGSREVQPFLLQAAASTNSLVAGAAFQALARLSGPRDAPAIVELLLSLQTPEARAAAGETAAVVLSRIEGTAPRSEVVRAAYAKATTPEARASVIALLPMAPDTNTLALLAECSRDTREASGRDAAIRALSEWPDPAAWELLEVTYQTDPDPAHRALALRALVRLAGDLNAHPDAALVARYQSLLKQARNPEERKQVLGALGGAALPETLALALSQLEQPDVRPEAELAVTRIAEALKTSQPQLSKDALEQLKSASPTAR